MPSLSALRIPTTAEISAIITKESLQIQQEP
jgi:hypothetical protein